MGPEGYLPFFDRPEDIRREHHEEPEHGPEEHETENPYIEPLGELGKEAYLEAVDYLCEIRAGHPLWSDVRIIKEARVRFELHGHKWDLALERAIKNGEVPPAKKRTPTRKVIDPKSLRRFGGNANADKRVPEKD